MAQGKWSAYQISHEISRNGKMDSIANFEMNFAKLLPTPRTRCEGEYEGFEDFEGEAPRPRTPLVSKSQPRTGHTREPDPKHLEQKHERNHT